MPAISRAACDDGFPLRSPWWATLRCCSWMNRPPGWCAARARAVRCCGPDMACLCLQDPETRRQIWDIINAEKRGGRCIVITTHSMEVLGERRAATPSHSRQRGCPAPPPGGGHAVHTHRHHVWRQPAVPGDAAALEAPVRQGLSPDAESPGSQRPDRGIRGASPHRRRHAEHASWPLGPLCSAHRLCQRTSSPSGGLPPGAHLPSDPRRATGLACFRWRRRRPEATTGCLACRLRAGLTIRDAAQIAELFRVMEERREEAGIVEWGVAQTSLEEVFVRIALEAEGAPDLAATSAPVPV